MQMLLAADAVSRHCRAAVLPYCCAALLLYRPYWRVAYVPCRVIAV
ncbi:hypothetical protein [Paractinoplanes maris]|nr:hypothetical protein [Actinoplanes maris]